MRLVLVSESSTGRSHDAVPLIVGNSLTSPVSTRLGTVHSCSNRPVLRPPVESGQYLSIAYTERLQRADIEASVGTVGSSYDCEDDGRSVGEMRLPYDK